MTTYRDGAGKAPEEHLRKVLFEGQRWSVYPRSRGAFICPACGAWLFWPFADSAERWFDGDGTRGALLRRCTSCRYTWFVEGLRT